MVQVLVAWSGGKDSQAALIWAVKKYGAKYITAVFCDTGWEHPLTYMHVVEVSRTLGVNLMWLKSAQHDGFVGLAKNKKRFPSTKARFCTEMLKSRPMIDYVLQQNTHLLIVQGIRKDESEARSQMAAQCAFFKYYTTPYGHDKKGKPKYHTYRKKEVLEWRKEHLDDVLRPVFEWTAQQTINYIVESGQEPNPLYRMGMARVGCFPCIMARHSEVLQIIKFFPEYWERLESAEAEIGRTFFPPNYIPERFQTGRDAEGNTFPFAVDVKNYLTRKDAQTDLFYEPDQDGRCMSLYGICE